MEMRAKCSKQSVFLSGTEAVRDVMVVLEKKLTELGFRPLWHSDKNFPVYTMNAMDNCLQVAANCDRMIAIVDVRAGLYHRASRTTISEAEFNVAFNRGIPCLVFIRREVWEYSRVYHRLRTRKRCCLTDNQFQAASLRGDQEVYEFIERLQHKQTMGIPTVPWLIRFDTAFDIVNHVKGKWLNEETAHPMDEHLESEGIHEVAVYMTISVRHFMNRLMNADFDRYHRLIKSFERILRNTRECSRDCHIRWTNVTLRKQRYPRPRIDKDPKLKYVAFDDVEFYFSETKNKKRISIWIARRIAPKP